MITAQSTMMPDKRLTQLLRKHAWVLLVCAGLGGFWGKLQAEDLFAYYGRMAIEVGYTASYEQKKQWEAGERIERKWTEDFHVLAANIREDFKDAPVRLSDMHVIRSRMYNKYVLMLGIKGKDDVEVDRYLKKITDNHVARLQKKERAEEKSNTDVWVRQNTVSSVFPSGVTHCNNGCHVMMPFIYAVIFPAAVFLLLALAEYFNRSFRQRVG